jgi:hypothetical protein
MIRHFLYARFAVLAGLAVGVPAYGKYSTPMRDVDNRARQPVKFSFDISINTGTDQGSNSSAITVPTGKRLVIETISYQGKIPSGEVGYLGISFSSGAGTAAGPTGGTHVVPMIKLTTGFPSGDHIGGLATVRIYCDAGSTTTVGYNRGASLMTGETISVTVTGYYVNLL